MNLRESMLIPLCKPLQAYWYGDIEGGESYIEKQTLPEGTPCGGFKIVTYDDAIILVGFTAMIRPGIFNRYRAVVPREGWVKV